MGWYGLWVKYGGVEYGLKVNGLNMDGLNMDQSKPNPTQSNPFFLFTSKIGSTLSKNGGENRTRILRRVNKNHAFIEIK